jgi:hypothetical protein
MREVDRIAIEETGPNLYQMMENAGRNLALCAIDILGTDWSKAHVVVLSGTGGNGGNGICAARHVANRNLSNGPTIPASPFWRLMSPPALIQPPVMHPVNTHGSPGQRPWRCQRRGFYRTRRGALPGGYRHIASSIPEDGTGLHKFIRFALLDSTEGRGNSLLSDPRAAFDDSVPAPSVQRFQRRGPHQTEVR